VGGQDFPGRVYEEPKSGGSGERPYEHAPAVVTGQDAVSADVVEGEGERGQQCSDQAIGIEAKASPIIWLCFDDADDQGNPGNSQRDGHEFLQRKLLLAARHDIKQDPHRSCVLHDDRGGDIRPLNRDIIEIIRDSHSKRAQKEAVGEIARGQLDALPALGTYEKRKQHEQREGRAGLRKNERLNRTQEWTKSGVQERQASGKDGPAQDGGNSPKKRRRGNEEITTERMWARAWLIWVRDGVRNNEPQESI